MHDLGCLTVDESMATVSSIAYSNPVDLGGIAQFACVPHRPRESALGGPGIPIVWKNPLRPTIVGRISIPWPRRNALKKIFILVLLPAAILSACVSVSPGNPTVGVEVQTMLDAQIAAWNRGDIDAFMESYWSDPAVRFASGGNVRRGWQTVLNDYRARYPDTSAMGRLTTAGLEITEIGPAAAVAFGHWIVTAGGQDYCGLFTLIVRKVENRWVIVHDHTSEANGPDSHGRTCAQIKASG